MGGGEVLGGLWGEGRCWADCVGGGEVLDAGWTVWEEVRCWMLGGLCGRR